MKVRDKVVCINAKGWYDDDTGEGDLSYDPKKDDILTVSGFQYKSGECFLEFKEIPFFNKDGLRQSYSIEQFRKIEPNAAKELVEELMDNPEWVEKVPEPMQKIFSLTEDF